MRYLEDVVDTAGAVVNYSWHKSSLEMIKSLS